MSHSLVEIPRSEWHRLRDLYIGHTKCSVGFTLIRNFVNCIEKEPELDVTIYSLDGDWENDGLYIIIDKLTRDSRIFFNILGNNFERLGIALDCLDRITSKIFFAVGKRLMPTLMQFFERNGFDLNDIFIDETIWFHIEREKALAFNIELLEGIVLSPLTVKHAHIINSVWPHRSDDSIVYIESLIKFFDNVGAFDEHGNLVGWCLRQQVGSLCALQVLESHKRKGLGSLVVRYMARHIASKGEEVLSPVVITNTPSRRLFEKLGFQQIDKVSWAHVHKK